MQDRAEKIIEIAGRFNLLETKAQPLVDELLEIALEAHQTLIAPAILLTQSGNANDYGEDFLKELTEDLLLDELVLRITKLQLLFYLIRTSRTPWIYAAKGAILGTYAELATSCYHILISDPLAQFGYPAIEAGLFPWGGSIESTLFRFSSISVWAKTPVFSARDITLQNITIFPVSSSRWMRSIQNWLQTQLPLMLKRDPVLVPKDNKDNLQQLRRNYEAGLEGTRYLRPEWLKDIQENPRATSWDLSYELIRKNKREISLSNRLLLLANIAARHMVSETFTGWYEARCGRSKLAVHALPPPVQKVFVDLHYVVPPAESMIRLLERGFELVFFAEDADELRRGLELAFARMERARTLDEVQRLWSQGISWFVARNESSYEPVLRWTPDDKVIYEYKGESLEWIRIAGNRGRASLGICEWVSEADISTIAEDESFQMLLLLSEGLVQTKPFPHPLFSTSLFIRSCMFEELLRCAGIAGQEVAKVVEGLSVSWASLGSQGFWNRFLAARHAIQPVDSSLLKIGNKSLWPTAFEIGLWKESRALNVSTKKDDPVHGLNPIILSEHFAILAGALSALIFQNKRVARIEDADTLVALSTGFPQSKGLPSTHLLKLGSHRVRSYVSRYWPELLPDVEKFLAEEKRPINSTT